MKEVIMENIRAEALRFIRDGVPIEERGSQWDEFIKIAIADAKKQVEHEQILKVEKAERRLATKSGLTYEEWLAKVRKLYSINPEDATVTSIASGPEFGKTWVCDDQVTARKKVLQLMRYMQYNHFDRIGSGCEFRYDPDKVI
jgi:hypothetical protein